MTKSYAETELEYKETHNLSADYKLPKKAIPADFPIEHARLRRTKWIMAIFILSTSLYGLFLSFPNLLARPGWIAVPLIF